MRSYWSTSPTCHGICQTRPEKAKELSSILYMSDDEKQEMSGERCQTYDVRSNFKSVAPRQTVLRSFSGFSTLFSWRTAEFVFQTSDYRLDRKSQGTAHTKCQQGLKDGLLEDRVEDWEQYSCKNDQTVRGFKSRTPSSNRWSLSLTLHPWPAMILSHVIFFPPKNTRARNMW